MFSNRSYGAVWGLLGLFVLIGALAAQGPESAAYQSLVLTRQGVLAGEVWRLVTYVFVTGSWLDLLFTVLIFYYIAAPLEAAWGTRRFLTVFGVSVIGGGLAGVLLKLPQPLAGGGAPIVTLMLIYGFMFPDSVAYVFFILPMRVKTLAIILTALYLVQCVRLGMQGLALFSGLFCGVLYYVLTTGTIPWVRRAKRRIRQAAEDPAGAVRGISTSALMSQARDIMRRRDSGQPLTDHDRALIGDLIQRSDPAHELCSPYSFSPDNTICPPCQAFGRCLRRYLEAEEK
jgi:membrane associated rhomboid family serine protease